MKFGELCESAKKGRICGDDLCYGGDVTLCGFDKEAYDEMVREEEDYFCDERFAAEPEEERMSGTDINGTGSMNHCLDCCCARSWKALGVDSYTGKSIVEHIEELRSANAALMARVDALLDAAAILQNQLLDKSDELSEIIDGMRHRTIPYPTATLESYLKDFDRIVKARLEKRRG